MKRIALLLPLLALVADARETDPATDAPVVHALPSRDGLADLDMFGPHGVFVSVTNGVVDAGTKPPDDDDDLSYWFNCTYDDKTLTVWVAVLDDDFRRADSCPSNATSCAAWDDDAVEIFVDGECARLPDSRADGGVHLRHGGEFAIVANGAANSDFSGYPNTFFRIDPERFDEKTLAALKALGESTNAWWSGCAMPFPAGPGRPADSSPLTLYIFHVPWSAMGRTNRPDRIGFNIGVQDDDGGGRRDHALYWTGNPKRPFSDESAFGVLVFDPHAESAAPAPRADSAEATSPPRPAFTMRIDDNRPASWWRDVGDIFERHGFRCSFAVNATELSESQGACLKELAARGHEIMDHTPSHNIYLAKYPDAESFERARRLPFAHDADPETRKVFFSWDVRDDHPSNTTFRARVEAGRLVPSDEKTAPKGHCFLKLPGHEGVFGLQPVDGNLELRDFWGRRPPEPLDLPECDILRYASAAMRPCDGLLRELASLSRERFDHFGIPRPTSWVFPGGWCSHIPQDGMERVYGRGFGYRTADAQLGDAKLGESPWFVPYNAMLFFDQGPDITAEGLVDGIEKRLAAGKWHITLSHMMTRDIKDFLAKTERFVQLLEERRIPVLTLADSVAARFPETAAEPAMEVALAFDGSAKEHATIVAPMLAEYGWHGTFDLVVGDVGAREDTLDWDDARDLVRAGHILAAQTRAPFARPLDEGKEDDLRREILDSAAKIEAETGFRADAVCGFRVQETRRAGAEGEPFDVAEFRAMLERNVAEGRPLCVLAFPGIGKTGSRPFPNGAADLRAAFDVLRDMERAGVIRVVSGKTESIP